MGDKFAERLSAVTASATLQVSQKAAQMREAGEDVISLSVGEPDFTTPKHICHAAGQAINEGQTRYTPVGGTPRLKEAIVHKLKRDNGLSYESSEIVASTGAKQVIFNAMMATLNPLDEVLIVAPYWVSYPHMVRLAGGVPIVVSTSAQDHYTLKREALEKAVTKRTRWLFLNAPSNPTGKIYSPEELKEIGTFLKDHPEVYLLTDDIYEHICFDDLPFKNMLNVFPELKERVLIVNGVSKAYAMTGWRIGYGAGPEGLIRAMTRVQSHSTSNPCSISQAASVAALTESQDALHVHSQLFENRRDMAMEAISSLPHITCFEPQGAFYVFLDCKALIQQMDSTSPFSIKDDQSLADFLLTQHKIALVPGADFGAPGCLRLSFALDSDLLEEALERLMKGIKQLSPAP